MISATYTDPENIFEITAILEDDETNLRQSVARFIELTRAAGYQPGSWADVIGELWSLPNDYDVFEWASEVIYAGE